MPLAGPAQGSSTRGCPALPCSLPWFPQAQSAPDVEGAVPGRCRDHGIGSHHHPAAPIPILHVPRSSSGMPGVFPGGAPLCKPRQRRRPGNRGLTLSLWMMSGLATTREDERKAAGPPPWERGRGERGWDARDAGGMWVGCGAPGPTAWARTIPWLREPQPLSGCGAGACRSPCRVPGERSAPAATQGMQHYPQSMDHYGINKRKVVLQMRLSYRFTTRGEASHAGRDTDGSMSEQMGADSEAPRSRQAVAACPLCPPRLCAHSSLSCSHSPPSCTHSPSLCTHSPPSCTYSTPSCIHSPLSCSHSPPSCTHSPPLCIPSTPLCTHSPLSCTYSPYSCTHSSLSCTHGPSPCTHSSHPTPPAGPSSKEGSLFPGPPRSLCGDQPGLHSR